MKVLQFITRLDLGGAQECCLDLCRELLRREHEVHLLTADGGELLPDARRMNGLVVHTWPEWKHAITPVDDLRCTLRLARWLRRERFDVLHTHSSKAGLFGRLAAARAGEPRRVIHHVHGWSFNRTMPPLKRSIFVGLEKLAARPGFLMLSCSEATDREGRRAGVGRDADRRVVNYAIDRAEFLRQRDRAALRRRLGLPRGAVLFLQVGNLKPQKDPLTFAQAAIVAAQRLPRAHFWIAGDGPLRAEVERRARQAGLGRRLRVLGWRRDVPELLAAADVSVLTSRFEGLPLAIVRSMAAGRPVVASAVDGTPEAIRDGVEGLLVEPGDVEGFARAFERVGADPGLRRRMGLAGRRRSASWNAVDRLAQMIGLYATDDDTPELPRTAASARSLLPSVG